MATIGTITPPTQPRWSITWISATPSISAIRPFYGFNRPDAKPLDGVIENWWRQGMMGSAKAHYDSIKAFSENRLQ